MSRKIAICRDASKTGNLTDCAIAKSFYEEFCVADNFGKLIPNEEFNQWILEKKFEGMDHGWGSKRGRTSWNGYRRTIRDYIKSGIMTKEYAQTGYEPYCLEVKEHGQSLIITRFSDVVVENYKKLSNKRMKNIKNKDKSLKKDFKVLTETYNIKPIDAIIQEGIISSQNQMRYEFEGICGKIVTNTMKDIMKSIADSKKAVKEITHKLFTYDDDDDYHDGARASI